MLYCSKNIYKLLLLISLISISSTVFATDILAGTTNDLVDTLNTSGKVYIYIAEFVLSVAAYIKTKNILFLAGIVIISVFFNIMLSVAGIS